MERHRRLPVGAEICAGGVHFRVWATGRRLVKVVLGRSRDRVLPLEASGDGYFSGLISGVEAGELYWFRLDDAGDFPDPASRFQPEGPHGPSQVVDPALFRWSDHNWPGASLKGQVIYEMHIGTFTQEGTWEAAIRQLPELAETGITVLEVMPVAEFPGRFGWGYDGVALFAPTRLYGEPDDFRRFVDEAHRLQMAVILDVVYNHLGPDGNYVREFSEHYFTKKYDNEWGDAINFDGDHSGPVRELFIGNAGYWIDEYHLDGLRLDATQQMFDESEPHVLVEIGNRVREAAKGRETILITENESQHARLVRPVQKGGYGLDGLWNDDLHHSAKVVLTGKNDAYYTDHLGKPQEFVSAMKWGYLFQGQWYKWQKKRRGMAALDLEPYQFVNYLENHDQIANSGRGERLHQLASAGRYRAMSALLLLGTGTPMLFQGQEFAASSPFYYFADHNPELAELVRKGRTEFLSQFPDLALPEMQSQLADPADEQTFLSSKLDHSERQKHAKLYQMHKDLLRLRREDPVFSLHRKRAVDGAVLSDDCFMLRFFADDGLDRLLVVNLGPNLHLEPAPEPLLAPPDGMRWETLWSSDAVAYGGCGTPPLDNDGENWRIPGEATVALQPVPGNSITR